MRECFRLKLPTILKQRKRAQPLLILDVWIILQVRETGKYFHNQNSSAKRQQLFGNGCLNRHHYVNLLYKKNKNPKNIETV
jgi:hypothetical protein